ncbi:MAG: hypothetical protein LBT79_07950 [Elusimicrobiota bacterium]|jgi:hypothetical protein|nr:hypothetical protein [Elusimicrobiota bacterium]
MQTIENLTSESNQKHTIIIETGEKLVIELFYCSTQIGWYINASLNDWSIKGIRVVNSPNLLRQFNNVISFGIACDVNDLNEPLSIQDFLVGRANLHILNKEDVNYIEEMLNAKIQ